MDTIAPGKSWADEYGDEEDSFQPQVYTDEDGNKVIIEFRDNDDGKKVKVTRKIRSKLVTEHVNKAVAQRKKWKKFGMEEGRKAGPDLSTTTIGENIPLKLKSSTGKDAEAAAEEEAKIKLQSQLKTKNIACRICKGEHFTSKCPYKDTMQPLDEIASTIESVKLDAGDVTTTDDNAGPNKYTPPHLRNKTGTSSAGESMREKRDDSATLRVTNLSEDVTDSDIYDLFNRFGSISRVYLARDRETNLCKGFAFVSFSLREDAERAQQAINGYGYDSLILRVEFARTNQPKVKNLIKNIYKSKPSASFKPTQGTIGVDNEISLLKYEQQQQEQHQHPQQPNDQAMDLFLNQVVDYNAHNNAFHQHQPDTSSHHSNNNDIFNTQQNDLKMDEFVKPDATKKEKQKSKEGGHSSLLQVFTNPLLHAIPILARNCLNFEDFVAQTSFPDHNGLLGPMKDTDEPIEGDMVASPVIKSDTPWHIRVLGLPYMGGKSRVETQIKISLQLADSQGELATEWTHLKLPEHLVAKDKLKRRNPKYGTEEKAALVESKVLSLEAAVICETHPDDQIIMCTSCVHRERKRLKRKRDNKVARAANKEGNAAKLAALLSTNELPDLNDNAIMEEERRRILLFNCSDLVEFNSGEAVIPTRITCYCRHHSEKIGFRIVFVIKDSNDQVLATGRSPPIMITDDHKSSKIQQQSSARKRARTDMDTSATESDAPLSSASRRRIDFEIDSGVSSPLTSTPATPSSQNEENIPENNDQRNSSIDTTALRDNNNERQSPSLEIHQHQPSQLSNIVESSEHPYFTTPNNHTFAHAESSGPTGMELSNNELYDFLNSGDINMIHSSQTHTKERVQPEQHLPPPGALPHHLPDTNTNNTNSLQLTQQQHFNQNLLHQQQLLSQFNQNTLLLNSRNKKSNPLSLIPSASTAWKCMLERNKEEINSRIQDLLKEVEEWEATKRIINELLNQ
ncbi:eukaryotic translation initiation factor 3 subunit G-domain-containing protein [Sporodiniella umbellata]|nr:eukaryotic translation initiation factor 3 subunit G-domain-containing protein [Sporodiniella umbellata]